MYVTVSFEAAAGANATAPFAPGAMSGRKPVGSRLTVKGSLLRKMTVTVSPTRTLRMGPAPQQVTAQEGKDKHSVTDCEVGGCYAMHAFTAATRIAAVQIPRPGPGKSRALHSLQAAGLEANNCCQVRRGGTCARQRRVAYLRFQYG